MNHIAREKALSKDTSLPLPIPMSLMTAPTPAIMMRVKPKARIVLHICAINFPSLSATTWIGSLAVPRAPAFDDFCSDTPMKVPSYYKCIYKTSTSSNYNLIYSLSSRRSALTRALTYWAIADWSECSEGWLSNNLITSSGSLRL